VYLKVIKTSSTVAEIGDHLATVDIGQKVGGCCSSFWGELGPHLTQCGLGQGLPPYQVASWFIQPFATVDMGQNVGCAVPLFWGGAGSPSNTMSPGLKSTSVPSGILIHPAVWLQQTWAKNWGWVHSSSNTVWPGPRPSYILSGILIHPTVWPQYTNVTDRQTDRTDNVLIA